MEHYHPTHVLLVGDPVVGTDAYNRILVDALFAAVDVSEMIQVRLDTDLFEDEHPDVIEALEERFEARPDGKKTVYSGRSTRKIAAPLEALLTVDTWHRVHAIGSIRLLRGNQICLKYLPDHSSFTVDDDSNSSIVSAVRGSLEGHPADLFPKRTLVKWECGGTDYSVEPPSLCVGNICYQLRTLAGIDPRPDDHAIGLSWHGRSGRFGTNVLESLTDLVGAGRPEELRFESQETFDAARETLERVVEVTGTSIRSG